MAFISKSAVRLIWNILLMAAALTLVVFQVVKGAEWWDYLQSLLLFMAAFCGLVSWLVARINVHSAKQLTIIGYVFTWLFILSVPIVDWLLKK